VAETVNAIEAVAVSKVYRRYAHKRQFATLKSALLSRSMIRDLRPEETFPALRDVSFAVPRGATYGIVGRNGSGKSTMLKCVAGITKPTSGHLTVRGRVSALIELGAGFHPEISGRENVFINGIMLGLSKKEITRRFDEIVDFAELRDFIDAPVKTYSSGMYMRLGFAVAIHVDPEVLLVDEVLAVGDEGFTHKCLDKFAEFRRRGKTILIVTHSLPLVERFCDEALWLDGGTVRAIGDTRRVVGAYVTDVGQSEEAAIAAADARTRARISGEAPPDQDHQLPPVPFPTDPSATLSDMFRSTEGRWGSREIEILEVMLTGPGGEPRHLFQTGDPLIVRIRARAPQRMTDFAFGVAVFNADGVCCYGTNTWLEKLGGREFTGEGEIRFVIDRLDLVEGTYKVDVAVHNRDGYPYDYHRLLYTFRMKSRMKDVGVFRPPHRWEFSPAIIMEPADRLGPRHPASEPGAQADEPA